VYLLYYLNVIFECKLIVINYVFKGDNFKVKNIVKKIIFLNKIYNNGKLNLLILWLVDEYIRKYFIY
jgi:hypothetical protein